MATAQHPPSGPSAKVLIGVGVVCLGAFGLAVAAAVGGDDSSTSASTSTTTAPAQTPLDGSTATSAAADPVDVPVAPAGETITGATPCPAEDGSSPRVTSFEQAPPTCIDLDGEYRATIRTDAGDLVLLLDASRAPQSVNNFVVLSRYHYYDGQALDGALPRSHVQFGGAVAGDGLGYRIPGEQVETIYTLGTIGFVPGEDGSSGAEFFLTTYDDAADLPVLTTFGILLDGAQTMAALDRLGTPSGEPSGVVTISSIDIEPLDLDG